MSKKTKKSEGDKEFVLARFPGAKAARRKVYAGTKTYGWVIEGVGGLPIAPQQRGEDAAWAEAAKAIRNYREQ
jgi:hypothetical protein